MISLSMLVVGILVGLMLYPMVEVLRTEHSLIGAMKMNIMKGGEIVAEQKDRCCNTYQKETEYQNKVFSDIKDLENNIESIQLYIHINILFTVPHLEQEQYEFLKKLEKHLWQVR